MRWKTPIYLDTRTVKKFLFKPKCLNGECRWLEIAYIRQIYQFDKWHDMQFDV